MCSVIGHNCAGHLPCVMPDNCIPWCFLGDSSFSLGIPWTLDSRIVLH